MKSGLPKNVKIVEVGPRDGLQNISKTVPTADKLKFIQVLSESGLKVIEATAFVHPKWVPQMADATAVMQGLKRQANIMYPVLVPNLNGYERALATGAKEVAVFVAASETFSKKNTNCTIDESLQRVREVISRAQADGVWARAYISTCFVCPFEGDVAPHVVLDLTQKLFDLGFNELSIGDTIGKATTQQVAQLLKLYIEAKLPIDKVAMHFHDTFGRALENVQVSLEHGVAIYDSSAGGLGGCPYAPGASGNVATESLVRYLDGLGIETGVDAAAVAKAALELKEGL